MAKKTAVLEREVTPPAGAERYTVPFIRTYGDNPQERTCSKCGLRYELTYDNFPVKGTRLSGEPSYSHVCRECTRAHAREWARQNQDKVKANQADWNLENADANRARAKRWRDAQRAKDPAFFKKWPSYQKRIKQQLTGPAL
jgi:hypothetical protein